MVFVVNKKCIHKYLTEHKVDSSYELECKFVSVHFKSGSLTDISKVFVLNLVES